MALVTLQRSTTPSAASSSASNSEVSPRPHDTGMVTMVTQWQNEFELHARAILGLPVDTTLKSPGASAVSAPAIATP